MADREYMAFVRWLVSQGRLFGKLRIPTEANYRGSSEYKKWLESGNVGYSEIPRGYKAPTSSDTQLYYPEWLVQNRWPWEKLWEPGDPRSMQGGVGAKGWTPFSPDDPMFAGYPAGSQEDIAQRFGIATLPKGGRQVVSTAAPTKQPEYEAKAEDYEVFVPGEIWRNKVTGQYWTWDKLGIITEPMAYEMRNEYRVAKDRPSDNFRELQQQIAYNRNLQQQIATTGALRGAPSNKQNELTWEAARQSILSELTGPRDWITRWQAQQARNPWIPPTKEETEEQELRREARRVGESVARLERLAESYPEQKWIRPAAEAERKAKYALEDELKEVSRPPGIKRGEKPRVAEPTGPPAPAWLGQFSPEAQAGQPISPLMRVETPSGQTFSRTPYSQREGLAGFTEYTGGSYPDLLSQMAMMQTETPRIPYQWSPTRQR